LIAARSATYPKKIRRRRFSAGSGGFFSAFVRFLLFFIVIEQDKPEFM